MLITYYESRTLLSTFNINLIFTTTLLGLRDLDRVTWQAFPESWSLNYISVSLVEKAMAPHSSTLAWKIPWMEEPGRLQSMGSLRVGHDWVTSFSLLTFMHWRRKWQPTPVFLPGESQGRGSLVGWRLKTEATQQQQYLWRSIKVLSGEGGDRKYEENEDNFHNLCFTWMLDTLYQLCGI